MIALVLQTHLHKQNVSSNDILQTHTQYSCFKKERKKPLRSNHTLKNSFSARGEETKFTGSSHFSIFYRKRGTHIVSLNSSWAIPRES